MYPDNPHPLDAYAELEPLCGKGHVVLVQNREDGQLYVKKRVLSYTPELYRRLREDPPANTPVIYGIYEDPEPRTQTAGAVPLILIEEYLPGHTLAEHLCDDGVFSEAEVIRIGLELCAVLEELHSRRPAIIHRDIKPSNVMLLPDGSVRLLDFSASKPENLRKNRDTVLIGTAGYAAPEQYGFSASTAQTDIYAMGVLLNTLRTGAMPWAQRAGGQLERIIERCLKIDPKDRYAAVWELQDALMRARRKRVEWLPPGFRSLRWYRMLPAGIYYGVVGWFCFGWPERQHLPLLERMLDALLLLIPVLFYGNYLDIQRFFPFMKSRKRWVRRLSLVLGPVWFLVILVTGVLLVTMLESLE